MLENEPYLNSISSTSALMRSIKTREASFNSSLSFNDLYLDINRKEMSVKKYRSQRNIEKSYLHKQLEYINVILKNTKVKRITFKSYGDLYLTFSKKGIVLEILNDTHLENACLFRVFYKADIVNYSYECCIQNNKLVFSDINFK